MLCAEDLLKILIEMQLTKNIIMEHGEHNLLLHRKRQNKVSSTTDQTKYLKTRASVDSTAQRVQEQAD